MSSALLFSPGLMSATPGALEDIEEVGLTPLDLLSRHLRGDWGDLGEEDREENQLALISKQPLRIFSAYRLINGKRIWVITEADRSSTTLLRPEDY